MTKFWRSHKNCSIWLLPEQAEILREAAAKRGFRKADFIKAAIYQSLSSTEREAWRECEIQNQCAKADVSRIG